MSLPADRLTAERVEPLLRGRFGRPYLYRSDCTSTQLLLGTESPEGSVAVCEHQSAGRGRLRRTWQAPAGAAILCSVLLRPAEEKRFPDLTLVAGLATARAVEATTRSATAIKWPNDIMLDGQKVAGILAQVVDHTVVLGIGLNVNQDRHELPSPDETKVPAGSLYAHDGQIRDRAPLLAELLFRFEQDYEVWRAQGLASLIDSIQARDFLRGKRVVVDDDSVQAVGINAAGRLEVQARGTTRVLESGEVNLALPDATSSEG